MRLRTTQILLYNLEGRKLPLRVQITPEAARQWLVEASGQDFGYDAKAWRKYIRSQGGESKALPGLYGRQNEKDVSTLQPSLYPQVNEPIYHLLSKMRKILGEKLVGVYLHGSLVNGDFDIEVSDIDLLVALTDDLNQTDFVALQTMHDDTALKFPLWRDRIETAYLSLSALKTFKTQSSKIGNISPGEPFHIFDAGKDWLPNWYMVQEKGKTLFGPPPGTMIDPISSEEFVQAVRGHMAIWRDYSNYSTHVDHRGSQAYAILTMCRAMYTTTHGEQVSKIQAAKWAEQALPEWADLIRQAVQWRKNWREENVDHAATLAETRRFVAFAVEKALNS